MSERDELQNEFQKLISDEMDKIINQFYTVSKEVSARGKIFQRAIGKGHPTEVIMVGQAIFQLHLN